MEVSEADATKFKTNMMLRMAFGRAKVVGGSRSSRKAPKLNRHIAGQSPTGREADRYGIPNDIAAQVNCITFCALACTAEALEASSSTYKLYDTSFWSWFELGKRRGKCDKFAPGVQGLS